MLLSSATECGRYCRPPQRADAAVGCDAFHAIGAVPAPLTMDAAALPSAAASVDADTTVESPSSIAEIASSASLTLVFHDVTIGYACAVVARNTRVFVTCDVGRAFR